MQKTRKFKQVDVFSAKPNACLAQILKGNGFPDGVNTAKQYRVRQGTALQRDGRVTVTLISLPIVSLLRLTSVRIMYIMLNTIWHS